MTRRGKQGQRHAKHAPTVPATPAQHEATPVVIEVQQSVTLAAIPEQHVFTPPTMASGILESMKMKYKTV